MDYFNWYKLNSNIKFNVLKDNVYYSNNPINEMSYKDPRCDLLKYHTISEEKYNKNNELYNEYEKIRILNGIAEGNEMNNLFPLECNLDLINGISFNKGCYLGQEKVSYMHSRVYLFNQNLIIRRIRPFKCDDNSNELIIPSELISKEWNNKTKLGNIISYNKGILKINLELNLGLCNINLDGLKQCKEIKSNNTKISINPINN